MTAVDRRININTKRPSPPWIKMILLVAVFVGIFIRGCWNKEQSEQIVITNARVQEHSSASIDVVFTIENKSSRRVEKNVIIKVFAESGEEIASRITSVTLLPETKKTHLKVLQKLNRPIKSETDVKNVTVELFVPSILN